MNDPLPDRVVIVLILFALIIVFSLAFLSRPPQGSQPTIQWKDTPDATSEPFGI